MQLKRPLRRFFCVLFPVNHAAASVPRSWSIVPLAVILKPTRIFSQIRQPLAIARARALPDPRSAASWCTVYGSRLEIRRQLGKIQTRDPPAAGHDPPPAGHVFRLGSLDNRGILRWP